MKNDHTENAIWIGLNNYCHDVEDVRNRVEFIVKNGSNRSSEEERVACEIDLNQVDWAEVKEAFYE